MINILGGPLVNFIIGFYGVVPKTRITPNTSNITENKGDVRNTWQYRPLALSFTLMTVYEINKYIYSKIVSE